MSGDGCLFASWVHWVHFVCLFVVYRTSLVCFWISMRHWQLCSLFIVCVFVIIGVSLRSCFVLFVVRCDCFIIYMWRWAWQGPIYKTIKTTMDSKNDRSNSFNQMVALTRWINGYSFFFMRHWWQCATDVCCNGFADFLCFWLQFFILWFRFLVFRFIISGLRFFISFWGLRYS